MTMTYSASEVISKVSNGVLAVSLDGVEMASFDLEGRVLYYAIGSLIYRRSIYNHVYRLEWRGKEERIVQRIENPSPLIERAYELAREALEVTDDSSVRNALKVTAGRTALWLCEDVKKLNSLYSRISIVPPDLYFSTYLQLTTGCTWNLCTFCTLYKDRTFSLKSREQFSQHIRAVKAYLGRGLDARKRVFLGDANAMDVSQKLLRHVLLNIGQELEDPPVYSFVDAFTTPKNLTRMDFGELHDLGLERVYLGLESGNPEVLKILNKPMSLPETKEFVNQLKSVGVKLGVIILIGAGGHKYWQDHVTMTCSALEEMNLGQGDIVYLSPLVETETYNKLTESLHLGSLHDKQKEKQTQEFLDQLKETHKINCPVVPYNIRESFLS